MDERKRESIVAYLRRRMAEFGIKPDDVAASLAADVQQTRAERYRDAFGHTWDGTGEMPQWVKHAMSAGQSLEHFAIAETPTDGVDKPQPAERKMDPFAGTRLATLNREQDSRFAPKAK